MSGLEVCRDVLGAFPTLLAALDDYRTGFGVLKFRGQNNRDIDVLQKTVQIEHVRLLKLLELLLKPMDIEVLDIVNRESPKGMGSSLDAGFEASLSNGYPVFVELMSSIAVCVNELVRRLGKPASTSVPRSKLRLISSRKDVDYLVRMLVDYIDRLHRPRYFHILTMKLYITPTGESKRARELLPHANMAQSDVYILHWALYPVKEILKVQKWFLECFQISNFSQHRRQLQLLVTPPASPAIHIKSRQNHWLKICVDFDKELGERSGLPNFRTTRELELSIIRPETSMQPPSNEQRQSMRLQSPTVSHSEVLQQSRPAKIVSLLEFRHMFHASELPSAYGPISIEDCAMLIDKTDMLSLEDLLRSSIRISTVARTYLAASLTWSVICLIDTPWLKQGLKAVDIFFTRDQNVIRVDEPLICHSFDHDDTEHTDPKSLLEGRIFRLGVLLLELSLHQNIEDLQEGQQPDDIPYELAERLLVSQMIADVYAESGVDYGNLARRCVSFQFDSSLDSQHPKSLEEIQVFLIGNVFSPLEALLKLLGGLGSKPTIDIEGSGVINPELKRLSDKPTTEDRAKGLHEPSFRPPIEDFSLKDMSTLRQYASRVYQKCDADTFAFTRVTLAAKETLLGIEEADDLTHRVSLDGSDEKELLDLCRDCLASFVSLETFVQRAKDGEALDDLTNRFTLDSGSLAVFNKRFTSLPSNAIDLNINSVTSASEPNVNPISSISDAEISSSSSATNRLKPVWADSRQLADSFWSLIRDEALLGPLLMSIFEELEDSDDTDLRSYLHHLLGKYSEELLLQVLQKPGLKSLHLAATMIHGQASYIVDKMYAEYTFRHRSATKMVEQMMLRMPGEMQEQRSQRVSKIVADIAEVATRSELLERKSSIISTDGSPHRNSNVPAIMIQTGFKRRSAANLGRTTIDSNAKIDFGVVKDFLVSGIAFAHLRLALRDILHQKPMDIVRQEVFSRFPSNESSYDVSFVNFLVYWDIRQYLKEELTPRQSLASVLTVSGGSRDAFATPCASYMQWLWPDTSNDLLDALDQTMKRGNYVSADGSLQISEKLPKESDPDYKLSISVIGTKYKVSNIAQQLVWLSNVLRTTQSTNELSLSRMEFMWIDRGRFELRPGRLAIVSAEDDSCWHPLLGKTVIADGFPIPPRDGEVGLEIPFQSLIRLSKVDAEMEFDNRIVLYGPSSLLYPTSLNVESYTERTTPRCIQWHLIAGESPHISASLLAEDPNWATVDDKTFLPTGRSIVGYCKTARILVGTEEYRYDKTKGSELLDDESMPDVRIKSINLSAGFAGVVGLQVPVDVVHPRSMEVSPEITKYDDILVTARTMSMILYDAGEQRGWLLPVQHVLLHMAQCWIKRHTPGVRLPYAKPEWEGENAVEKTLIDNYKLLVKTLLDDDSEWFLRDLIKQIWRDLQGCRIARKQRKSEDKANHTLPSAKLLAWEFLEFINRPPEFRMRKFPIEFSGCGWDALAEDDDMMILAGRGLGDIILPADTVQLCKKWSTVPLNRAYLTASISCMRIVPQSRVGGLCMSLTRRVFWRPTAKSLLDDCAHGGHTACHKSLQKVISKVDAAPIASTAFPPSGAVVFGVNKLHRSLKQFSEVQHRRARKDESDEADKIGKKSKWHIFKRSNR